MVERVIKIKALLHRATSLLSLFGCALENFVVCVCWLVGFILFVWLSLLCVCVWKGNVFQPITTDHFLILYSWACPFLSILSVSSMSHSTWAIKARRWNWRKKNRITFRQIPGIWPPPLHRLVDTTWRRKNLFYFLNFCFLFSSTWFIYYDDDLSPIFFVFFLKERGKNNQGVNASTICASAANKFRISRRQNKRQMWQIIEGGGLFCHKIDMYK